MKYSGICAVMHKLMPGVIILKRTRRTREIGLLRVVYAFSSLYHVFYQPWSLPSIIDFLCAWHLRHVSIG